MIPTLDHTTINQLAQTYLTMLLDDTVPFWLDRCKHYLDREHGGYCHMVDHDGTLIDTDKSIWAQGRNAWLWATLCNTVEKTDVWREAAELGIGFLDEHGFDPEDGRMWFHVARDGTPIRKRRYALSESFAAIAYAAWAKLTDSAAYADKAVACFEQYVNHQPAAKFTKHRPTISISMPMITIATAQTLRENIGFDQADTIIDRAIEQIESRFVKDDLQVVLEQAMPNGGIIDHVDGRTLNPGHAIEAAWFILEEASHRGHDAHLVELGCRMLDYMWRRGWDQTHGGIIYFVDLFDRPPQEYWHDMKFWWPQNETIIATLMAYLATGDSRYAQWHHDAHEWAYKNFHDTQNGEWFGYLHRDGSRSTTTKGNLWKSPFHLPRMQWQCWRVLCAFSKRAKPMVPHAL